MSYDDAGPIASSARVEDDAPDKDSPTVSTDRRPGGHIGLARSCYSDRRTDWRTRSVGMGGTASVFLLIFAAVFLTWRTAYPVRAVSEPLAVNLQPLSSPDTAQEVPDGPVRIEQRAAQPPRLPDTPPLMPLRDIPREPASSEPAAEPSPPAPAVAATSAPKSIPAPPAPSASSNASATWEAQLLAHLEKHRRYPAAARARREQGVAHVRFLMNRDGRVLSIAILRSSGSAALDRAALDTLRRAQPLPTIPPDKPAPLELAVPVEFFVRR